MTRFVILLNFTERGVMAVKNSCQRADAFRAMAAEMGVKVEAQYWTLGSHDGVVVLSAPDENAAAAAVLRLGGEANVRTCMLRAFDEDEFRKIVQRIG